MIELRYRPNEFDDWGMIRNADGSMFASVRRPASEEELAEHRRAGTDPYEDLARRLIASFEPAPKIPAPQSLADVVDDDRMIQIADLIKELQDVRDRFGNTCVYIRRAGLSWGAVALNRRSDDEKNGVFDLQAQHDRDMLARLEQIERLKEMNRSLHKELDAALSATRPEAQL